MKIHVQDLSDNGEVVVRGLYGPDTVLRQLHEINIRIQKINQELRSAYGL